VSFKITNSNLEDETGHVTNYPAGKPLLWDGVVKKARALIH